MVTFCCYGSHGWQEIEFDSLSRDFHPHRDVCYQNVRLDESSVPWAFWPGRESILCSCRNPQKAEDVGPAGHSQAGGSTLTLGSKTVNSSQPTRLRDDQSPWYPRQCVWGALDGWHVERPVIFIMTNVLAAGRNGAAHDALCVEVLKTSAGLGLSLDGGKSSVSGDGPLVIKRVYKGKYSSMKTHPSV